jgi:hypothetical protein
MPQLIRSTTGLLAGAAPGQGLHQYLPWQLVTGAAVSGLSSLESSAGPSGTVATAQGKSSSKAVGCMPAWPRMALEGKCNDAMHGQTV